MRLMKDVSGRGWGGGFGFRLWMVAAALVFAGASMGWGAVGTGLSYSVSGTTLTITTSQGSTPVMNEFSKKGTDWWDDGKNIETVVFKPNNQGRNVTNIGAYAFYGLVKLKTIELPEGVTKIEKGAFDSCVSLVSIKIPDNVVTLGDDVFLGCSSLVSITIPNKVTSIGANSFLNCSKLATVNIGSSVTTIGANAFEGCAALVSINIPDKVTSIGAGAFLNCSALASVTLGSGLTSIGTEAFKGCERLVSITIPDKVTSIGKDAFAGCSNMTSITLGTGLTQIGSIGFSDNESLEIIELKQTAPPGLLSLLEEAKPFSAENQISACLDVPDLSVKAYQNHDEYWGQFQCINGEVPVSFVSRGVSVDRRWVKKGETFDIDNIPDDPSYDDGHEFTGWFELVGNHKWDFDVDKVSGPTTLYASWRGVYTIQWMDKDGVTPAATTEVKEGEGPITKTQEVLAKETREYKPGYTFNGWFDADGMEVTEAYLSEKDLDYGIVFYGRWTLDSHSIEWYYDVHDIGVEGKSPDHVELVDYDSWIVRQAIPDRSGYNIGGWYDYDNPESQAQFPLQVKGDMKFYVNWSLINYNIYYYHKGQELSSLKPSSYNVTQGEVLLPTLTPEDIPGYTFNKWQEKISSCPDPEEVVEGGAEPEPCVPRFGDLVDKISPNTIPPKSDPPSGVQRIEYYADARLDEYDITYYRDSYSAENKVDPTSGNPAKYTYESPEISLYPPTRTGTDANDYEFIGWTGSNGDIPQLEVKIPTGSTTGPKNYIENWALKHSIEVIGGTAAIVNGETEILTTSAISGKTIKLTANAPATGYKFVDWGIDNAVGDEHPVVIKNDNTFLMPERNVVITANFEKENYHVNVDVNDDTFGDVTPDNTTANFEDQIKLVVSVKEDGYYLKSWRVVFVNEDDDEEVIQISEIDSTFTMPASDVTVEAVFDLIPKYEVTVNNGTTDDDGDDFYAEHETVSITAADPENYQIFDKWTIVPSDVQLANRFSESTTFTMPGTDVTVTAHYKDTYPVTVIINDISTDGGRYAKDSTVTVTAPLTAGDDLVFDEWEISPTDVSFENEDATSIKITMPAEEVTVTAKYRELSPETDIVITWNGNGGTPALSNTVLRLGAPIKTVSVSRGDDYTFVGWYDNSECTGTAVTFAGVNATVSTTYWAKWTANPYTINYELNNGTNPTDAPTSYTVESLLITLPTPTRADYTFDGWFTTGTFTGAKVETIATGSTGDKTFYAKWTATPYTITYELNNGANPTNAPTSYTVESLLITLPTPTRAGYTFDGWFTTETFTGAKVETIAAGSSGDKTFYAKWTATTYTITYNLNGGANPANAPTSYTIESETITLPTPTKDDYTFAGWFTTETFTGAKVETIATGSSENKEYWAKWTLTPYTITYELDNGTNPTDAPTSYTVEDLPVTLPDLPTKTGYTFGGWFTTSNTNTGTAVTTIPVGSTGNKTYWAKWTAKSYSITYNVNGGSAVASANYTIESSPITLPTPTKDDYTFAGWFTTETFTGAKVETIATGSSGDKEYWAKWTPTPFAITYTLNGGTNPTSAPTSYTVESLLITLPTPTRAGYTFDGWFTTETFTGEKVETIAAGSTGAKAFYAKWTQLDYAITASSATLSFSTLVVGYTQPDAKTVTITNVGSNAVTLAQTVAPATMATNYATISLSSTSLAVNGTATLTVRPKAGLAVGDYNMTITIAGTGAGTAATASVAVTFSVSDKPVYNVTWDADDGTPVPTVTTVVEGGSIASPATMTKTGYNFAGWYTNSSFTTPATFPVTNVTSDKEFYAKWTPTNYTITYTLGGGTVTPSGANPTTYNVETSTFTLVNPTRAGYAFEGWTGSNGAVKQMEVTIDQGSYGNKTYTANWTAVEYVITLNAVGGTASAASVKTGTGGKLTSMPTATKTGYTLAGWYTEEEGGTQVTTSFAFEDDAEIYARWTLVNYTITYTLGGGVATPANPTSYNVETPDITLNEPVRAAYQFDGWTGTNGTTKQKEVTIEQGSTGNRNYTANWTALSFTITLDENGGTKLTKDTVKTAAGGKLASLPAAPTKAGYAFNGWFTEPDGGDKVSTSTVFEDDATIYAQWSEVFTITFDSNGGTAVSPATASTGAGGKLASLPTPTRVNFTFAGWYTEKEDGTRVTTSTVFDGDATIYAQWTSYSKTTVKYSAGVNGSLRVTVDGVSISTGDSVRVGKDVVFTAVPDEGYGVGVWTVNGVALTDTVLTYVLPGVKEAAVVSVSFVVKTDAVKEVGREIPGKSAEEVAVVGPVVKRSQNLTVGPSPVKAGSEAVIYWKGGKSVSGTLSVFDATGKRVASVKVKGVGRIGAWSVSGVAEGTYLIRGVLADKDGVKVNVSAPVGVTR